MKAIKNIFRKPVEYADKYGITSRGCSKASFYLGIIFGLAVGVWCVSTSNLPKILFRVVFGLIAMTVACVMPRVFQYINGSYEIVKHRLL